MRKQLFLLSFVTLFIACNNEADKTTTTTTTAPAEKTAIDLPYKANYSVSYNDQVSDADLKTVLQSYKDWELGKMDELSKALADSVYFDNWNGDQKNWARADLIKTWSAYRDSLSSIKIEMDVWQKSHFTDKNDDIISVWYKETVTYKNGNVESAYLHDLNQVKNGKIIWYSQYRRPINK